MQAQFEDLIFEQGELHGRIARAVENLKKMGQANITLGAVQSRIANLDKNWEKFEEQLKELRTEH